jgi:isoleucyl-tRNA synthetase
MEAGTLRVLAQLLDRGLLDVRFTAVPWCPMCASTLANAEQEDRLVTVPAWLVPFELTDGSALLSWTTTPWTLPLHRALVLNADAEYVELALGEHKAWVCEPTADHWCEALGALRTGAVRDGANFSGMTYRTPWTTGRVVVDSAVLASAGTGALHAVPGLSELDTELGRRHGWELLQHLTTDGMVMLSPCESQNGLAAGPMSNAPVRPLYETSPWFRELPYKSAQPHCWRHHTPLLTRASRQVFLRLDSSVRARAEDMVSEMEFTPESGRARLLSTMRTRPDWCLSRQRTWGVPLALFLERATGQPHALASKWMHRVADALSCEGVEAWWARDPDEWVADDVDPSTVECVDDVLDVWFDSGCVPQLLGNADVVVEGTDQHRGWFQSCLWLAAALDQPLPFKRVVTHGFVMDADGTKLSKSKGGDKNANKLETWQDLPTDVVRVWALSGTDGNDKAWTADTVLAAKGVLARWRGVLRFLVANLLPGVGRGDMKSAPAWDRYWVEQCRLHTNKVLELCGDGRMGEAVSCLQVFAEAFSSQALGSWKDRLYCAPAATNERQQLDCVARACLAYWHRSLSVLTPRLAAEACGYFTPLTGELNAPPLTGVELDEVNRVLDLRAALAPAAEVLARDKGGAVIRRLSGWGNAPVWGGQLLADALDVGQYVASDHALPQVVVELNSTDVTLGFGRSPDPVCPRCRRAQHAWEGDWCGVCAERLG